MGTIAKQIMVKEWCAFFPGKQKQFIEDVLRKSRLTISELATLTSVSSRSFRDWREERARINVVAAELLCEKFAIELPESKEMLVARWRKSQYEANRKGGFATTKKYGSFLTAEGRRRGGLKAIALLRKRGLTPPEKYFEQPDYSVALAEFVGIMLGDGCITPGQCNITLNSEADKVYVQFIIPFCEKLFGVKPKVYKRKDSKAIVIYYNGIFLIRYLLGIGLRIGDKVRQQVGVPRWILDNNNYRVACIRGLMDTDGGVFTHRYKVNRKEYVYNQVCFTNHSIPLLIFVHETLSDLGFNPKLVGNKKVWLYDQNKTLRYNAMIGTHNERLGKYFGEWAGR